MPNPARRVRPVREATVVRREELSPSMVRIVLTGPALDELPFTDHYVKLLFPPAGADYTWPFDPEQIRATLPAEQWPVTRTYTIRAYDPATAELALDFVVHGADGLAGPWARDAAPGDRIAFFGPGGAWAPSATADVHLLVGDEAALPAIAAALDRLGDRPAEVYVEVAGPACEQPLPQPVHWVYRAPGVVPGLTVAGAVRTAGLPTGRVEAFVHGNAEMVADLRRFLFVEQRLPRNQVSISGYWRTDHTEDRWQATKRDFNEAMEAEEQRLVATS